MDKNLSLILKDSILISDVVGEYVALSKKGKNFFGLCPFHEDTTPSLVANNDKKMFKCFVCGVGGNLITFVMKKENISFPMALIKIGKKYGIKNEAISMLEKKNKMTDDEKEFYEINFQAAEIYHNFLFEKENKKAKDYLYLRGLSDSDIKRFQIGFAPKGFDTLINLMTNKTNIFGANRDKTLIWEIPKLLKAKLILLNDKGDYQDFFYNQIIFPIRDEFKRVVAFSGRSINNGITPKYLNSMSSDYFKKDSILYNMENVWNKPETRLFITEGFMDVILASKNGIENIVATMGVELSKNHILKIKKNNFKSIIISMDNDKAGKKSNLIIGKKLLQSDCNVMVINSYNSELKDLADLANSINNSTKFTDIINNYVTYLEYLIDISFEKSLLVDAEIEKIEEIAELISKYGKVSMRHHYATLISSKTKWEKIAIIETIDSYGKKLISKNHPNNNFETQEFSHENIMNPGNYLEFNSSENYSNDWERKIPIDIQKREKKLFMIMAVNHEVAKIFIENLNDTISLQKDREYLMLLDIIRNLSSKSNRTYFVDDVINQIENKELGSIGLIFDIKKYKMEIIGINILHIKNQGLKIIIDLMQDKQKLSDKQFGNELGKTTGNFIKTNEIKIRRKQSEKNYDTIIQKIRNMITIVN